MSREAPQFKLRMDIELKELVERSAQDNHRSINAEIVARLQESFEPKAVAEGKATILELKTMMTEVSLLGALLAMVQQQPQSDERDAVLQQLITRVGDMSSMQQRFAELIRALPVEQPEKLQVEGFSVEKRPVMPTPTAKRPLRKQTRPLGMDQAEWEAKRLAELAAEQASTTATPAEPAQRPGRGLRRKTTKPE